MIYLIRAENLAGCDQTDVPDAILLEFGAMDMFVHILMDLHKGLCSGDFAVRIAIVLSG